MDVYSEVLKLLSQYPDGVPQSLLYRVLPFSKPYISIVLSKLEKQGIIYRTRIGNTYIVKPVKPVQRSFESRVLSLGIVWSSEYLFLGHFVKRLRDDAQLELEVKVYPSAVKATMALLIGDVDVVLSPLITQVYAYALSKGLRIVGGGAGGGSAIYEINGGVEGVATSSEMSTMDLCRALAVKKGIIQAEHVTYFSSPEEAVKILKMKRARYAIVWHPLQHEVEKLGGKTIEECESFEETKHCCTLAVATSLPIDIVDRIAKIYRSSIEEFKKSKQRFLEWYSTLTGIDTATLKKALELYHYEENIDLKSIEKLLNFINLQVPHIKTLHSAIYK
jgi:predicted transcriptional regulator